MKIKPPAMGVQNHGRSDFSPQFFRIQTKILEETAALVKEKTGEAFDHLTIEKAGDSGYHFLDKYANRIVIERKSR